MRHSDYLNIRHFDGLNGLRAIAIIAVVWHHATTPAFLPIANRGFIGVDLFFVLSGYLISTLLIREKTKTGAISLKDFWMRRILRLVPAYYLLLFGLLGAYLLLKPGAPETQTFVQGFPVYALYFSNWIDPGANNLSLTWSLATEEQFYLIWPLFEAMAAPIVMVGFWAVALVVNQLINFGVLDAAIAAQFGADATSLEILDATFTPILLGVALAHLLSTERSFDRLNTVLGRPASPFVILALLLIVLNIPVGDISGAMRLSIHVLMFLWLASIVLQPQSVLTRALESKWIAYVGIISYGMYLYHMWCIHIARVAISKLGAPQLWLQFPMPRS